MSVIFSGAMVSIGVFGVAKLLWLVFAASPEVVHVAKTLLLGMGLASALIGGVMALAQRHIKRLLAFSTISHVGIMLTGLALMDRDGTAGMLAYVSGHGMVKAALFMIAGLLGAKCGGIDEMELRGKGRPYWPVGLLMAYGGLLLAGLPLGPMDEGISLISAAARQDGRDWVSLPVLIGAALTGAAVLRVSGRVFAGWGEVPGDEGRSPSEQEQEKSDRPVLVLVAPAAIVLALGAIEWDSSGRLATHAASMLMQRDPAPAPLLTGSVGPWLAVSAAVAIASYNLRRHHLPHWITRAVAGPSSPPLNALRAVHSGLVGDYVAWVAVGLALFSIVFMLV